MLPQHIVLKVVFRGSKHSSKFQLKDSTIFSHNHDLIYHGNCPLNGCRDNHIGETSRRVSERVLDHTGRDINSHVYKHSIEIGHQNVEISDYQICENGYGNNWNKRKIVETLLAKEVNPTLNKQDKSIALKIFN